MNKERVADYLKGKRVIVSAGVILTSFGLAPVLSGQIDRIVTTVGAVASAHLALEGYHALRRRAKQKRER